MTSSVQTLVVSPHQDFEQGRLAIQDARNYFLIRQLGGVREL